MQDRTVTFHIQAASASTEAEHSIQLLVSHWFFSDYI